MFISYFTESGLKHKSFKSCTPCDLNRMPVHTWNNLIWHEQRREGSCLHMVPWNQCWSLVNNFLKEVVLVILRFFLLIIKIPPPLRGILLFSLEFWLTLLIYFRKILKKFMNGVYPDVRYFTNFQWPWPIFQGHTPL